MVSLNPITYNEAEILDHVLCPNWLKKSPAWWFTSLFCLPRQPITLVHSTSYWYKLKLEDTYAYFKISLLFVSAATFDPSISPIYKWHNLTDIPISNTRFLCDMNLIVYVNELGLFILAWIRITLYSPRRGIRGATLTTKCPSPTNKYHEETL